MKKSELNGRTLKTQCGSPLAGFQFDWFMQHFAKMPGNCVWEKNLHFTTFALFLRGEGGVIEGGGVKDLTFCVMKFLWQNVYFL